MTRHIFRGVLPALAALALGVILAQTTAYNAVRPGSASAAPAPIAPLGLASTPPASVPLGVWGATGRASLSLTAAGGSIALPCQEGALAGPLVLDSAGHFTATGTIGEQRSLRVFYQPAQFSGTLLGETLTMTVRANSQEVGAYTLTRGLRAYPAACY